MIMNQVPENSLRTYDIILVTSYLIGLIRMMLAQHCCVQTATNLNWFYFTHCNLTYPIIKFKFLPF